jgi:hypothetical protein
MLKDGDFNSSSMVAALYSLIGTIPVLFSHLPYVVGIPFSFELFGNYE